MSGPLDPVPDAAEASLEAVAPAAATARDAARAGLWSGIDLFLRQGLQFAVTVALARLIAPEAFGTIALLAVFISLFTMILEGGANTALLRTPGSTRRQESSVFWFNLGAGLVFGVFLIAVSPLVARFYEAPLLAPLMVVAAAQVLFVSAGSLHSALLTRALRFRSLLVVGLCSTLASGTVGVTLALLGYGVWALAFQTLTAAAVGAALLWIVNPWRPLLACSFSEARGLFRFGSHIVLSGMMDVLYTQGFALLIGKMYGVRDVGFYARAQNTQALPVGIISAVIGRVTLPVLATRIDDSEGLRRALARSMRLAMALSLPTMVGLAVLSDLAVLLLYGPAWAPVAPILAVLALVGSFYPHALILQHGLLAQDKSGAYLRLIAMKQALGLATMIVGSYFGIMGLAYSQIVYGIGGALMNAHAGSRHTGYRLMAQLRDLADIFVLAAAMGGFLLLLRRWIDLPPAYEAAVLIPAGAAFYLGAGFLLRISVVLDAARLTADAVRRRA